MNIKFWPKPIDDNDSCLRAVIPAIGADQFPEVFPMQPIVSASEDEVAIGLTMPQLHDGENVQLAVRIIDRGFKELALDKQDHNVVAQGWRNPNPVAQGWRNPNPDQLNAVDQPELVARKQFNRKHRTQRNTRNPNSKVNKHFTIGEAEKKMSALEDEGETMTTRFNTSINELEEGLCAIEDEEEAAIDYLNEKTVKRNAQQIQQEDAQRARAMALVNSIDKVREERRVKKEQSPEYRLIQLEKSLADQTKKMNDLTNAAIEFDQRINQTIQTTEKNVRDKIQEEKDAKGLLRTKVAVKIPNSKAGVIAYAKNMKCTVM